MHAAGPEVAACGDVLGVVFDGEDEAVIFAPHSGDVLISEVAQWRQLLQTRQSTAEAALATIPTPEPEANPLPVFPENDLRVALLQLGLKIG